MNLAQKILHEISGAADRPSLVELSADGGVARTVTRAQLLGEAAAWQNRFNDAGLRPGDAIGLRPPRNASLPAMHLAALGAGLAIVPINPALAESETSALLAAANLDHVYTEADTPPAASSENRFEVVDREDADVAMILYTSGTTGRPKSVPLSHGNLTYDLESLAAAWRRTSQDRLLHLLPAHHFHGLVLATYGSLLCGCEVYLAPKFDARTALDAIGRHAITLLMGVPTMYARMCDAATDDDDLAGLRLALSGSAPLDRATWSRFHERFGIRLVERYGLTETGIIATNAPTSPKPGSVGKAIPGTSIEILVDDAFCAPGNAVRTPRGEICVKGPSVTAGYGNAPEANRESFRDGRFRTGDLGHFDENGFLFIDGRAKELIIVGGTNVVPGEVERALEGVDGVRELAAAGIPDADLGEVVALFVALGPEASEQEVERLLRATAESALARYKRPRRYTFVEGLPRNAMGKIDRARLSGVA